MRNLHREQQVMENFLVDEGLTLIKSFEAGARTTMRHHMQKDSNPLETLVQETAKTGRIAYIYIMTRDGTIIAQAGQNEPGIDEELTAKVLSTGQYATRMTLRKNSDPIFEVISVFKTLTSCPMPKGRMQSRQHFGCKPAQLSQLSKGQAVIHLGLHTGEFVKVRQQDFIHTLFMAGLLLLIGTAGFYFLFLYHGMQVTRSTLANMKLYTKNIIESMPDGLITLDATGRIVSCNPRALELTEMDMKHLKDKRPEDVFTDWPGHTKAYQQADTFPSTFIHQDNTRIPVEISSSRLRDEQGNYLGSVFILRDLRTIRSMEKQLARSSRLAALGQMAAGIAHEIRNPLGTLRGFAQYFASSSEDKSAKEYSSLMIAEVDRLNESISALLQFSRPRTPEFTSIAPLAILEKSIKLLEYDFKDNTINLVTDFSCTGEIEADQDLLLQVMLNLLKNAINASHEGGTIHLGCKEKNRTIQIIVTDTGRGMNQVETGKMFDPFFTTKNSGTGLGLAVSHQIIEQHNGRFEVISQPDQGTTITIILPKDQNQPQETA
jgi:two-component system sensor histidine kinase HydH